MKLAYEWVAFKTILIREIRRAFRTWPQSLLPAIVTSTLYFIIFGRVMGQHIGMMHHFSYIQYIAPGLMMMQIISSAYTSSAFGLFMAKFQRQIQELLVSPMSAATLLFGFMAGAVLRGMIIGILVGCIAIFFTHLYFFSALIIISVVICSAALFALAGIINAIYAKNFDDISFVPNFILTPLTYLGGVFYSINLLPPFWQKLSLINPIVYIINVFRYGFLGISDTSIALAFVTIISILIILFIFAYYLINKGVGLRE